MRHKPLVWKTARSGLDGELATRFDGHLYFLFENDFDGETYATLEFHYDLDEDVPPIFLGSGRSIEEGKRLAQQHADKAIVAMIDKIQEFRVADAT